MTTAATISQVRDRAALWRLARWCGINPAYTNVRGQRVRASPEAVVHAVRAFGVDLKSPDRSHETLRQLRTAQHQHPLEPVYVIWAHPATHRPRRARIHLRIPSGHADHMLDCHLVTEDGEQRTWRVEPSRLPLTDEKRADDSAVYRWLDLPAPLQIGYHRFSMEIRGGRSEAHIFVAPMRTRQFADRQWGAFIPLYALRSDRNWGIGDFTDLHDLVAWVAEHGGGLIGTLPLLSLNNGASENAPSPYMPFSRMFWNECFVDVEAVPELGGCPEARQLIESADFQNELQRQRSNSHVDYQAVMSLKRRVLELLARAGATSSWRRDRVARESLRNQELMNYACFRAAVDTWGPSQTDWPEALRRRMTREDVDNDLVWYHLYVQSLCAEQLSNFPRASDNRCGLYLDVPIGVDPQGFDAWRYRDAFVHEASAGAPPDEFFTHGQNWGILPLHPQRARNDGHTCFRATLAHHLRFARAVRIDHVMWLHRVFWVPHGMPATEGVYVKYPADELYAVLCIESHRSGAPIVGENLGTVRPVVNRTMDRHGVNPLYVAQFAWTGDRRRPLAPPKKNAVASLNTHDTPTFASYWLEDDVQIRLELGLLTCEQADDELRNRKNVRESILAFVRRHRVRLRGGGRTEEDVCAIAQALLVELARSDAAIVLATLEDLWAEGRPQNVPGTSKPETGGERRRARSRNSGTCPMLLRCFSNSER